MPAYVIFVRDTPVRDEAEMAEYTRLAIMGMASGEHKVISRGRRTYWCGDAGISDDGGGPGLV